VAEPIDMSLRELFHDDAPFSSPNGPLLRHPRSDAPLLLSPLENVLSQKEASASFQMEGRRLPSFPNKRYYDARSAHTTAHSGQQ